MSSAALQPAPHQPTSLPTLDSHGSGQYTPDHYPIREGYYAREVPASALPVSSKRPSRSASSGTAAYPDHTAMSSRTAVATSIPVTTPDSGRRRHERHEAPIAPPRTSSTQYGAPGSRRAARAEERAANADRRATMGDTGSRSTPNGYEDSGSRTRSMQYETQRGSSSRDGLSTSLPVRSSNTSSSSRQPSREASEVLNRVLVSQPEVDLDREQERLGEAQPHQPMAVQEYDDVVPPPIVPTREGHDDSRSSRRSRHDHTKREKTSRFGDYYLGHTIGEGEFGKVKLGWKQDGGVQVAIKLIRRDSVGSNPSRLAKIYREVSILRGVSHPNIVRLHEMTETERHIGIVLEYASGGELFDYILTHRYLKDNAARRLFAQLVSGVGYLHKKGIVHRDLKLENLLLDRNRNIIITDFGFANTFDPNDELTEDEELGLGDREFVKRAGLDKKKSNGMRKGDLMQTSCGSPCYAAPELVVSDSLYTGRKVDVWSCGVILYAMLAGYLPFDDDPANPEGDNINLLYKYIVNTPLTFPEYVTPHARDLLRRILVPSPRKRADLFEVARHSWLSEYAHVVELITSTTTTSNEIQNATVPSADEEPTGLARSASVREPTKAKQASSTVGDLARKQGPVDPEEAATYAKQQRDNKRRTVQVEYVAPTTQTQRGGEPSGYASQSQRSGKARASSSTRGPLEIQISAEKSLPKEPYNTSPSHRARPPSTHQNPNSPAMRPGREGSRNETYTGTGRPATGGSVHSGNSRHGFGASRASYGQPLPPTVAGTNVHGRMSQPGNGAKNYTSSPGSREADLDFGRPSLAVPPKVSQISGFSNTPTQSSSDAKGHRRSNTIGEIGGKIFGRRGSIFGGRNKKRESQPPPEKNRKYPPVSMTNTIPGDSAGRPSMDSRASRRSFSQGLSIGNKRSGSMSGSQASQEKPPNSRRISLMRAMGLSKDGGTPPPDMSSLQHLPLQYAGQPDEQAVYSDEPQDRVNAGHSTDGTYDELHQPRVSPQQYQRYASSSRPTAIPTYLQQGGQESLGDYRVPVTSHPNEYSSEERETSRNRGVLQKNKRFVDAYDGGEEYGRSHDHAGSSGAAKRVMDFFRRRAKARGGEA